MRDRSCFKNIPIPCREEIIENFVTYHKYPSSGSLESLKKNLQLPPDYSLRQFQDNMVMGVFFIKESLATYIEENAKLTWIGLMNQIGGSLGMCMGASIISIAELIGLIFNLPIFAKKVVRKTLSFKRQQSTPHSVSAIRFDLMYAQLRILLNKCTFELCEKVLSQTGNT